MLDGWNTVGTTNATFNNTTAGWHRVRVEYREVGGNAMFNLYWTPPGAGQQAIPATSLRPDYNLATTKTVDDSTADSPGSVVKTNYGSVGGAIDPAYSLTQSTTTDPNGLNLSISSSYEAPRASNQYLRRLSRTLPAGNSYTYGYYAKGATADNPCTSGVESIDQGGMTSTRTSPTPASGSPMVEHSVYDVMGRPVASWKNGDNPTCITYDSSGRIATKTLPGSPTNRAVTYDHAVGGNPLASSVSDSAGTVTTVVDLLARQHRSTRSGV